jgi:hypothetical protein
MDERLRFVARLLDGEKMAPLCAEFGISRKTGYKIYDRYRDSGVQAFDSGVQAFTDRSRRPYRQANRLPAPIEATIVRVGVTQVGDHIWLVTFMHYDLGYFDDEACRLEPIENPFGPKVLPMCSE